MTQPNEFLSEASVRRTNPPVRLRMASKDMLSFRSMEVEWENVAGERHTWSSWADPTCGCFEAEVLLPSDVTKITVQFKVRTIFGAVDVYKIDRGNTNIFFRERGVGDYIVDVFKFRHTSTVDAYLSSGWATGLMGVDATFELAGTLGDTHICRAWNAGRDGPAESWEFWEGPDTRPCKEWPAALKAADDASATCCPPESLANDCESAYRRLAAAVGALQEIRRETISKLHSMEQQLKGQWVAVNSVNTLSAGLGIASAVALFLAPPIGIGLGVTSAAAGIGATAGDIIADTTKLSELRQQMSLNAWNTVAVSELYEVWMWERRRECESGRPVATKGMEQFCLDDIGLMSAQGVRVTATVANTIAQLADDGLNLGARGVATVGVRGAAVTAGKVLGAAGACVSTGIAIHGWANKKALQKTVSKQRDQLTASVLFTQRWLAMMSELQCPICLEDIDRLHEVRACANSWHYAHAVCLRQWEDSQEARGKQPLCPQCNGPLGPRSAVGILEHMIEEDSRHFLPERAPTILDT